MVLRNDKISYFIPAEEVILDKKTMAFVNALKLRIECARFTNKNFRNADLTDIGVTRKHNGWQVNIYFNPK